MTRTTPTRERAARARIRRAGSALSIAVALLAILGFVVVGAVSSSSDDASLGAMRIEAMRARYAAESGATLARAQQARDPAQPLTGTFTLPEGQQFTVIAPFVAEPGPPGVATIEGRCGRASVRIAVLPAPEAGPGGGGGAGADDDDAKGGKGKAKGHDKDKAKGKAAGHSKD